MKKYFLILVGLAFLQTANAQVGFGIKGGINLNKIHTDAGSLGNNYRESLDTKTGFSAGVFARIGNGIYIQPELLFSQRKGSLLVGGSDDFSLTVNNLDLPVLVGFKFFNVLRINAGPMASIKLSESYKSLGTSTTYKEDVKLKNATFGYQLGAGLSFGRLDIDVRKEGSLSSVSKHFDDPKFSQRMDGWQLTLGLRVL